MTSMHCRLLDQLEQINSIKHYKLRDFISQVK